MNKHRLKTKDIQRILSLIDKDHMELFDEKYVEALYRQYVAVEYDDADSISYLKNTLKDKKVLIVCPGSSISAHKDKIESFVADNEVEVISVNFKCPIVKPKYIFCANAKRIENVKGNDMCVRLITSNLIDIAEKNYEYAFSFNNCVYFNEVFCEDSTLMLLKILNSCGCREVYMAGFDGFSEKSENYYEQSYTKEKGKFIEIKTVQKILTEALSDMELHFLTPSAYDV